MSVIIKGMEMPTSCSVCPLLEGDRMDSLCHAASKWLDDDEHWTWYVYPEGDIDDSKPCNCPLVPVPPHGRMIDADALADVFRDFIAMYDSCPFSQLALQDKARRDELQSALAEVINAPTIIPAEEGE